MLSFPILAVCSTDAHPCYAVGACKIKANPPELSACLKTRSGKADALLACTKFRKDKDANRKDQGIANLEALFTE